MLHDQSAVSALESRVEELVRENKALWNRLEFHEQFNVSAVSWDTFRDREGKLLYVSPGFEKITGYESQDYIAGRIRFIDFVHPDDREIAAEYFNRQLDAQDFTNFYCCIVSKNGELKYLSVSSSRVLSRDNEYLGFRTSCIDVTELKNTSKSLKESEERYSLAISAANEGIWDWDIASNTTYLNPKLYELLGYSENDHEISQDFQSWASRIHPDDTRRVMDSLTDLLKDDKLFDVEYRYHGKAGNIRWLKSTGKAVRDSERKPVRMVASVRDVTRQKELELNLLMSEYRSRALLETIPDMVFRVGSNGIFIDYKADINDLYYQKETIIGKNIRDILPASVYNLIEAKIRKVLSTGELQTFEYQLDDSEKKVRHFEARMVPVRDEEVVAIVRDITENKLAREKIQKSEERFRAIADYSASWEAWFDPAGKLLWMNQYTEELSGYTPGECIAEGDDVLSLLITPEDLPMTREYFDNAVTGGSGTNKEIRMQRKNGSRFWASVSWRPILDSCGKSIGFRTSTFDITRRKLVEAELQKSELKYRLLAENISDVIWIYNFDQNRFTYVSPSVYDLRGFTAEEAMQQTLEESVSPSSSEQIKKINNHNINEFRANPLQKNVYYNEFQQPCKDGREIWVEITTRYQYSDNGEIEVLGVSRNIDARKKVSKELEDSNLRLKQAIGETRNLLKTKDKLFSVIAHDLRSPVGNFIQVLELLTGNMSIDEERRQEYLAGLKKASVTTLNLLDNLLNWSRCQTNSLDLKPSSFLINDLIADSAALYKSNAGVKSIRLDLRIEDALWVHADKESVQVVLRNLLSNAVKFTNPGGTIVISGYSGKNQVEVEISDNGVGMAEDVVGNILKPDFYFTTYGTMNEKGSGIGLALCREFVERNGGKISISSAVGKGSTFSFTLDRGLPVEKAAGAGSTLPAINYRLLSGKRILLVEDELFNQYFVQTLFAQWNVEGIILENGKLAIEFLQKEACDLVLMDIEMPVMDGFMAARIIRQETGLKVPIIAISANTGPEFVRRTLESGMNDYVIKPYEIRVLYTTILKVLGISDYYIAGNHSEEKTGAPAGFRFSNTAKLKRLLDNDNQQIRLMIGKFLEVSPALYNGILESYDKRDLASVKRAVHKLKSSTGLIADAGVVAVINEIHELSEDINNYEKLGPLINEFRDSYPGLCRELRSELSQMP